MLNQYFYALLTTGIVHLSLALFVLFKGPRQRINQAYALYSSSIAIWAIFEAFGITAQERSLALLLWRINHMGVIFIPIGFVHFVYCAVNVNNKKRKFIPLSYIVAFIFVGLNCTRLLILEVVPKFSFRWFINPGALYYLFFTIWACWILYGLFELFRGYFKSTGTRRNQLKYFCWSMLVAYCGGVPNFFPTFNIEIPILMPFGTYAIAIYAGFTAYAMLRYRLMDVNIVLTRAGIFAIVYILVLGFPFWLGYTTKSWFPATILAVLFATLGPFIYQYLRRRAEDIILKDQRRYQKALRELSKTMTRIRDLDKLLKMIVLAVVDTVKVSYAGIYLKEEEYKSYRLKHYFPKLAESRFPEFFPLDSSLINSLFQQKRPLIEEDIGGYAGFSLDSGLVIPCFMEDELLGFLIMGAKPNHQMYTPDDILVFETLSYSTSLAIENSIFWKEIEDRQRKARLQEMDTYSYSLAHEIYNPMYVISGEVGFLKKYLLKHITDPEDYKEAEAACKFALEASQRVSGMVEAIREFGAPVTDKDSPLKTEDIVETFYQVYYPKFKDKGIIFEKNIPQGLGYVRGQKPQLMQVLAILSDNAMHAMREAKEKKITLKAEPVNQDRIRIIFTDTGYGIKKEMLEIIFAPFTTTKASTEGTGMGLYNAKNMVERHKGKVWAESEGPGKGATFVIELPIAKDLKPEDLEIKDSKTLFIKPPEDRHP